MKRSRASEGGSSLGVLERGVWLLRARVRDDRAVEGFRSGFTSFDESIISLEVFGGQLVVVDNGFISYIYVCI